MMPSLPSASFPKNRRSVAAASALLFGLLTFGLHGTGCHEGYDFERKEYDRGTLGQELFKVWRNQAARARHDPEQKVQMLDKNRRAFVEAVDTIAPPGELEAVDTFLQRALQTVESGLLPPLTRKVRIAMEEAANDDAVMEAMASPGTPAPAHFIHPSVNASVTHHLAGFERFRELPKMAVDVLLPADGYNARGERVDDESTGFRALQSALADSLKAAKPPADGATPAAVGLRDMILTEDARFAADGTRSSGSGSANQPKALGGLMVAQFDRRGYPLVDVSAGDLPFPFVDRNDDNLADIDGQGRFVLEGTDNARVAPFAGVGPIGSFGSDDQKRVTTNEGPVFEYVNLGRTGLAFLLRETAILHQKSFMWDMVAGLPALLGDRVQMQDDAGSYTGFSPDQPLTDAAHAALNLLAFKEAPETLDALVRLLDDHTGKLAEVGLAVDEFSTFARQTSAEGMTDDATLVYDLLPVLEEISANPELWDDVMEALRDPVFLKTDEAIATLLKYRDKHVVPEPDGAYDRCFERCKNQYEQKATDDHPHGIGLVGRFECIRQCPTGKLFAKKTKFNAPESKDNRSVNQRIFHLLRDTSGVEYTLTLEEASIGGINLDQFPPLVRLPGAAEAFIATIAGNLKIADYVPQAWNDSLLGTLAGFLGIGNADMASLLSDMSGLFGAHLDAEPTPDQITRLFNSPDLKFETGQLTIDVTDPICKDGYVMANHHADGLFAAEASGLIDAVQPLAKAFSDHGREDLLAQLFIVVHRHYSTHDDLYKQKNGSPSPMKGANMVSYEPALLKAMKDGSMIESLHSLAQTLGRLDTAGEAEFDEQMRRLVYHATRTDDGFTGRGGETRLKLRDGRTVDATSRAHFLLKAVDELNRRLENKPQAKQRFEKAYDAAHGQFLRLERDGNGQAGFAEPGTIALATKAGRALADEAREMREAGTLISSLSDDWPRSFADMISARATVGAVDLVQKVADNEVHHGLVDALMGHLLVDRTGRRQLAALVHQMAARSAAAQNWVPVAHLLGDVLDPDRTWKVGARANLPLLSHVLEVQRALLELDKPGTGLDMIERALRQGDSGRAPVGTLATLISDYFRTNPVARAPYSVEDYRRVYLQLSAWLKDEARGLEQLYDIVEMRR